MSKKKKKRESRKKRHNKKSAPVILSEALVVTPEARAEILIGENNSKDNKVFVSKVKTNGLSDRNSLTMSEKFDCSGIVIEEVIFDRDIEAGIENTEGGEVKMVYISVLKKENAQRIENLLSKFNLSRSDKLSKKGRIVMRMEGGVGQIMPILEKSGMEIEYSEELLNQTQVL